jgi:hypothetical protein
MRTGLIAGIVGGLLCTTGFAGAAWFAYERFEAGTVEQRAQKVIHALEAHGLDIAYEKIVGDEIGGTLTLLKVKIKLPDGRDVEADELAVERFDYRSGNFPRFSDMQLRNGKGKPELFGGEIARLLKEAKIVDLRFDLAFSHEYSARSRTVEVKAAKLTVATAGTLSLAMTLGEWRPDPRPLAGRVARERSQIVKQLGERATLVSGTLRFDDGGFMRAYIAARAESEGKSEQIARGNLERELIRMIREADRNDQVTRGGLQAIINFLRRPQTVAIVANPPKPVELRRLETMWSANRGGLRDVLGLRFESRAEAPPKADPK